MLGLLSGCAGSDVALEGGLQALPTDIRTCPTNPVAIPEGPLNAGQTERLWGRDRVTIRKLDSCLERAITLWDGAVEAGL